MRKVFGLTRALWTPRSTALTATSYGLAPSCIVHGQRATIERDLAALRRVGVPIDRSVGRLGGRSLAPGVTWTPVALHPAEMTALVLAQAAAAGMPSGYAARSATAELTDALPRATREEVSRLTNRIRVIHNPPAVDPAVLRAIEQAVRNRRVVRSLPSWCRLRDAGRVFRLDRITAGSLTATPSPSRDLDNILGWVPEPTHYNTG